MEGFGARLRKLRMAKNITQEALGSSLGVSAQTISKWETGKSFPDILLLLPLARFFQVSVDILISDQFDEKKMRTATSTIETVPQKKGETYMEDEKKMRTATSTIETVPQKKGETYMEEWMNYGIGDLPQGFQLPATCAFPSTASCTFSSGSLCSFNTPPVSMCGVFNNSSTCMPTWADTVMCQTLISNGWCTT